MPVVLKELRDDFDGTLQAWTRDYTIWYGGPNQTLLQNECVAPIYI